MVKFQKGISFLIFEFQNFKDFAIQIFEIYLNCFAKKKERERIKVIMEIRINIKVIKEMT